MDYMDIWIYNRQPRIKVFLCYLLIFIAFFIFSDIMIYFYTKSIYKPIANYEINVTDPQITVKETAVSNVNGSIKGIIKNTTAEEIKNQYLKFDFYTPRDINVGTKYIAIDNLIQNEEKKYEVGFKYNNVTSVKISMIAKDETLKATPEELKIEPAYGTVGLMGALILIAYLLLP